MLPAVVIGAVLVAAVMSMASMAVDEPATVTIDVIGHQRWWEVKYPDNDVVTANEVHIPAGESIDLQLDSAALIHS